MKFLEELMNVLFQEYGGLLLTILSAVLSVIIALVFTKIVSDNVAIIKELNDIARSIGGWLND